MDIGVRAWLDQQDAHVTSSVRKHGWHIEYVGGGRCDVPGCSCGDDKDDADDSPAFAYTVGLYGMRHPELLMFGISPQIAAGVLNELGQRVREGATLMAGQLITFAHWSHTIVPEPVPNPGEIVFSACRYYGMEVPVLQLSYDDPQGRFPWEEGYAAPRMQPRPGTFRA